MELTKLNERIPEALSAMTLSDLKRRVEDCGVVGAGGAGFPTHLKLDARVRTVILNCAECEPLLSVDRMLLARFTREIFSALRSLSETLSAEVIVAVKRSYKETVAAVKEEIRGSDTELNESAETAARLKQAGRGVSLVLLNDVYPVGDEVILIYEATGRVLPPGTFPTENGFLVLNVETVLNIYHALADGAAVTHKWVTVSGEVQCPATVRVPVGASIKDAVSLAGGATTDTPAYITGGPMMGALASASDAVKKTTNAVIVLPGDHFLTRFFNRSPGVDLNRAASACCQCRTCTDTCPRHLLGYPIEPHRIMRGLATRSFGDTDAFKGAAYCAQCGVCEMVACPQGLAPRSLIRALKAALSKAGIKPEKLPPVEPNPAREFRQLREARLAVRLGLKKYDDTDNWSAL